MIRNWSVLPAQGTRRTGRPKLLLNVASSMLFFSFFVTVKKTQLKAPGEAAKRDARLWSGK